MGEQAGAPKSTCYLQRMPEVLASGESTQVSLRPPYNGVADPWQTKTSRSLPPHMEENILEPNPYT